MYAVIFRSVRTDAHHELYSEWVNKTDSAVETISGYLSQESFRDPVTRAGVSLEYFETLDSIEDWRKHPLHMEAQRLGHELFYESFHVEICEVDRAYRWMKSSGYQNT